jgi:hypothetical protein
MEIPFDFLVESKKQDPRNFSVENQELVLLDFLVESQKLDSSKFSMRKPRTRFSEVFWLEVWNMV